MLAYEDYANAISKTAKVQGVLKTVVNGAASEIKELADEIAEAQRELDRLKKTAGAQATPPALDRTIADLRKQLVGLGLIAPPGTPDLFDDSRMAVVSNVSSQPKAKVGASG